MKSILTYAAPLLETGSKCQALLDILYHRNTKTLMSLSYNFVRLRINYMIRDIFGV